MKKAAEKFIGDELPFNNPNFCRIIDFYLFNCPVSFYKRDKAGKIVQDRHVSKRAITFEQKGWQKGQLSTLLLSMKKVSSKQFTYQVVPPDGNVQTVFDNLQESGNKNDAYFEIAVYKENAEIRKTKSIFYFIRNAFAHGSFNVIKTNKGYVYSFESANKEDIKGLIRLREATLLTWMDLFNDGPKKANPSK